MLKKLAVRALMGILGLAAVLGWWTLKSRFSDHDSAGHEGIPSIIWEGGTPVILEAELTHDGVISAVFERGAVSDSEHGYLEAWQKVPAGKHRFTVSVPPKTSGNLEVRIDEPPVGAKVVAVVKNKGGEHRETAELTDPLQEGYGFTAHVELEDWATASPEGDLDSDDTGSPDAVEDSL